jgi:hypothetical protein
MARSTAVKVRTIIREFRFGKSTLQIFMDAKLAVTKIYGFVTQHKHQTKRCSYQVNFLDRCHTLIGKPVDEKRLSAVVLIRIVCGGVACWLSPQ